MVVSSDQLFRRAAFCGEERGEEGSFTRGHFSTAQDHRARGDGSGIGALPHYRRSGGPPRSATPGECFGFD